jgi:pimeloyl-ACP methyl ester carboxylesterase
MRTSFVTTPDGVRLAVYESGAPAGREILFMHGAGQSAMAWRAQLASAALAGHRMIAWDLRGHGASGKPLEREYYADGARWADELAAVIEATALRRPTVVAWSYAGTILGEYLVRRGAGRLAALNFVAAATRPGIDLFGPVLLGNAKGTMDEDAAVRAAATRAFVEGCFAAPPAAETIEAILAYNLAVPREVRAGMAGRKFDFDAAFAALALPVLVTHGLADRVVLPDMGRSTAARIPGARLSLYDGVGHCPFAEAQARFEAELAALVKEAGE